MQTAPPITRTRISDTSFPDRPGLYAVYESASSTRPLYVGKAQSQSLRQRWLRNHLKIRSGSSALRRSYAVYLELVAEKLRLPARYHEPDVEQAITDELNGCYVELYPMEWDGDIAGAEMRLIRTVDPLLNVLR